MEVCKEFLESFRDNKLSDCKAELASTFSNFQSKKLYGNSYDFGDFEKCINYKWAENDQIQGKYCSVQYFSSSSEVIPVMPRGSFFNQGWQHLDTRFGGAVCIPSTCDPNSFVPQLMEIILNGTDYSMSSDYIQEDYCQIKKTFRINASGMIGISFVLLFVILAVFSTIKTRKDKTSIYSCFCLIQNVKNIFKDESRDDSIDYLRGIKASGYLLTGFIHMILASVYYPSTNPKDILSYHNQSFKMVISQGAAGACLCIIISTFLLTRALWKMMDLNRLNIPLLYIYRYFRIVPLLFFVMFVEKFIMFDWISTMVDAPFLFSNQFSKIFKYYWLPLLQVQNYFVDVKEAFSPPAYYFAVDFHLFMVTPFVVYLLWKWKRPRYIILSSLLGISFYLNYSYIMNNFEYFKNMNYLSYEEKILSRYVQETQYSMQPWVIGMFFGCFTITHQSLEIFNKSKKIFYWILPISLSMISLARTEVVYLRDNCIYLMPFDKLFQSSMYLTIFFICHYGHKDLITRFLSLKIWIPLDRLGLTYLIAHAILYRWMLVMRMTPFEYTLPSIFEYFVYGSIVSFAYGLALNLLIEQPTINLFKFLFRASKEKKKNL